MITRLPLLLAALATATLIRPATAGRFRSDDPLSTDQDRIAIDQPTPWTLSNFYDFVEHTFAHRPSNLDHPAENTNTLGEVPDSSWFTNRIGHRPMTVDEVRRGPRTGLGPSEPWTIVRAKSGGITPGFTIRDAEGDIYFIKFDPEEHANLSTSTDVISSLFFHAIGYNVPQNFIAFFHPDRLVIAADAKVKEGGRKRKMESRDIDKILDNVVVRDDGRVRCVASKLLEGKALGPRKFHGTRPDDANDIFPHQHRRELRGLSVFSAWLNHDDSRSINSLDLFIETGGGKGYVHHHLVDFSSTLGSGSNRRRQIAPQDPRAGNEYIWAKRPALLSAVSLGLIDRPWRKVTYPDLPEVGRFESDYFQPQDWRPEYPNPAFERMQSSDAFWAARLVAAFSDEMVRAAVEEGRYDRPETFDSLRFKNLGEERGLASVDGYEREWFTFDNDTGELDPLGEPTAMVAPSTFIPDGEQPYLMVRIRTRSPDVASWHMAVDVYLRRAPTLTIVGIDREN